MKKSTGYYNENTIAKFTAALASAKDLVRSGQDLKVRISASNSKMGNVASVSTLPFLTCPSICKSTCGAKCYAAKLANMRPNVLKSYAINTALAILRPDLYWAQVNMAVMTSKFFRFHVSGDIMNRDYFDHMIECAVNNPSTHILVFTKQFEIVNSWITENGQLPANMHLLFSGWTNLEPVNPYQLPETNVIPKDESDAWWDQEPNASVCGGNCFNCAANSTGCWNSKTSKTILFPIH